MHVKCRVWQVQILDVILRDLAYAAQIDTNTEIIDLSLGTTVIIKVIVSNSEKFDTEPQKIADFYSCNRTLLSSHS